MQHQCVILTVAGSFVVGLAGGCSDLPGDKKTQGAVIGGLGGAAAGALVGGEENRLLGALIGGALGAGGGYLIGGQLDDDGDSDKAIEASKKAEANPATAEAARKASTADLNQDGFVTMDEVVAMKKAGFADAEMTSRLEKTGMFFELTPQQQQYLRTNGVSETVISSMQTMNAEARQRAAAKVAKTDTSTVGHK